MSEYVEIEQEPTDDPDVMLFVTNLNLSLEDAPEEYATPEEGDEGSPLAQALFVIPGIAALTIDDDELLVRREPGVAWYDLSEDVRDVLRDFFL